MIKFPSIEQFRNVIRHVKDNFAFAGLDEAGEPIFDRTRRMPTLRFRGTVKLHGTNAGIVFQDGQTIFQSRENELVEGMDNAGFKAAMYTRSEDLAKLLLTLKDEFAITFLDTIAVYGEWVGPGVNKSDTGIRNIPEKTFIIFAIKINEDWVDISRIKFNGFSTIFEFPTYELNIDFNQPELSQNTLIDLTMAVEEECPVAKAFGVIGIGEGIVWECLDPKYPGLRFKVKGEKHSNSKVRTLAPVDIEAIENMNAFIDSVVTENRLEQALGVLKNEMNKEANTANTGDFIRWVYNDILKEEIDTIEGNGLDIKKLGSPIASKARAWYFSHLD